MNIAEEYYRELYPKVNKLSYADKLCIEMMEGFHLKMMAEYDKLQVSKYSERVISSIQKLLDVFEYEGQTEGENVACYEAKKVIDLIKKDVITYEKGTT